MKIQLIYLLALLFSSFTQAGDVERRQLSVPTPHGMELELYKFSLAQLHKPQPALLLFHGGSWVKGSPSQLFRICSGLAEQGFTAFSAEYRLIGTNAATIADCVADVRTVYKWVEAHANELEIDASRLFVGGASAGGHLALCLVTLPIEGAQHPPKGFIGYNPVVSTTDERFAETFKDQVDQYDPVQHLSASMPPMLIFHGDSDTVVPIETVRTFARRAQDLGVSCTVETFPDCGHGFFNYSRITPEQMQRLKTQAGSFLRENTNEKL
jgi:acetyl esterase